MFRGIGSGLVPSYYPVVSLLR